MEHFDDVSLRELLVGISLFFVENKICPFLKEDICIYVGQST